MLGALLARAISSGPVAFVVGVLYAVTDELHQMLVPGRQGSLRDVLIDAAGVLAGVAIARRVALRRWRHA